jgi:hypothetical protein
MKPKARHSARYGYAAPQFLPPNPSTLCPLLFKNHDFATLDAWLAEDGWPDEHKGNRLAQHLDQRVVDARVLDASGSEEKLHRALP